jgi:hypothetical protein
MPGVSGVTVLCLTALLALTARPAAPTHTLGGASGGTTRGREGHSLSDTLTARWPDLCRVVQATPRLSLDLLPEVNPWSAVAFSLTNRLFAHVRAEGDHGEQREVALLRLSQGIEPRGQGPEALTRLTPPPFLTDLALEARAQPTSILSLRAKAVYSYAEGRFGHASAALTLQPLPRMTLALEPYLPSLEVITGRLGLDLPGGWRLLYAVGYHAPAQAWADQTLAVRYGSAFGNVGVQLTQGPEETRVTVQMSLPSLLLPKVVRTQTIYHHQRTYTRFAHEHVLAAHVSAVRSNWQERPPRTIP